MRTKAALGTLAGGSALGAAATLAWGVRSRSSQLFGPSVFRGDRNRRAIALTFDDGPSESTPALLETLNRYNAYATFFQCGVNVRRVPAIGRAVLAAGHEIGNHTETHQPLYLRPQSTVLHSFRAAQCTFEQILHISPRLMRAPFGARWFGFRAMQEQLNLLGVMWTVIGLDWKLNAVQIANRVLAAAANGTIICLHDGRGLCPRPEVRSTLGAVERILPALADKGFRFQTVSQLLCPTS